LSRKSEGTPLDGTLKRPLLARTPCRVTLSDGQTLERQRQAGSGAGTMGHDGENDGRDSHGQPTGGAVVERQARAGQRTTLPRAWLVRR
jgi:hypothetical protein